jgi:cyclopropane fatty-acyl-phospholipid synthase-like methyltransferase
VSIFFRAMYRFGVTPWDSGVPPPELKDLIEGAHKRNPGKALDLGCGTGTNAIYMTHHGWDVTAIDFVPRAIQSAKRKAEAANIRPTLLVGDVTKLDELKIGDGFTLVFDLGCFHAIPQQRRDDYVQGVTKRTTTGADLLLWGFYEKPNAFTNARVTKEEIEQRFNDGWQLAKAWGGEQPDRFPGRWYHLTRR